MAFFLVGTSDDFKSLEYSMTFINHVGSVYLYKLTIHAIEMASFNLH